MDWMEKIALIDQIQMRSSSTLDRQDKIGRLEELDRLDRLDLFGRLSPIDQKDLIFRYTDLIRQTGSSGQFRELGTHRLQRFDGQVKIGRVDRIESKSRTDIGSERGIKIGTGKGHGNEQMQALKRQKQKDTQKQNRTVDKLDQVT